MHEIKLTTEINHVDGNQTLNVSLVTDLPLKKHLSSLKATRRGQFVPSLDVRKLKIKKLPDLGALPFNPTPDQELYPRTPPELLHNEHGDEAISPVAGPITLFGLLTIVSLLFSIVLSVSMKFSPGGRSPPAWLF